MIEITLLNDRRLVINADLIEVIEETPDTIVTLTTERKIIVKESAEEIISRVITFRRRLYRRQLVNSDFDDLEN